MRLFFIFATTLCLNLIAQAGESPYAVKFIPEHLLKNANIVKRAEDIQIEVVNSGESLLHYKYVLTILNENGDRHATLTEWYDKLHEVRSIEGNLYDASGQLLKKVKNKDVMDLSGVDNSSLMDDNRVKVHSFYYKAYPYTIEYEVTTRFNHTFYFPKWIPQEYEQLSVENSSFTVITPADYKIRYKSFNYKEEPVVVTEKNKKKTTWQVKGIPAIKSPFAAPMWNEITPAIYLAPTDFEVEGYKGNMNSWLEFGKFIYSLKKDRDQLPDEVNQKVQQITAGISSNKEKVKALYQFMQQSTRYISIQLGIGGWQPFDASFVGKKGYGDCKALSNYMYSLLKAAGIPSYYTLINAGDDSDDKYLMDAFPSNQFNHVILCVPLQKDTMWLECTSQSKSAGYMGGFTGNRKALLIDEKGGILVETPRYGIKENTQIRAIKGIIDAEGNFTTKINTSFKAQQQDDLHEMLAYLSKDKVKKVLNEELNLSTYDIVDFKYQEKKDELPQIDEQLDLFVSKFATISGKRLFISPNLLNKSTTRLNTEEERTLDFVFGYEYKDVDTIEIEVPQGYELEAAPQPVALKTKFGSYSSSIKLNGNKLYYIRTREQYSGRFPSKDAAELANYYEAIYKADRSKVVLVKNSTSTP
ncbi:DUF3857 domain-containing protein [Chitinophagaceae bacterium LB-8]|uniref:DUF3857 domain-containing protein n=1 Tax=Paraflavisolibacter caeni TaxID=2982496 RepID=A0A9X3BK93_9BACT|nr:DUF3857 domain-containing protein [Paraflavisolibacter caeni]MCU7552458.1 DUF3857 domain-containing protein [Paraflavisolibacter caeni]